jgi:hypothetical protein
VRALGVVALLLIATAVLSPTRDWGPAMDARVVTDGLGAFVETAGAGRHKFHGAGELGPGDVVRFELLLAQPHEVMLAAIDPHGALRVLYPAGGSRTRGFDAGRHVLPITIGVDERSSDLFVVAIYSTAPVAFAELEAALDDLSKPLDLAQLWRAPMPGSPHWIHLPALGPDGRVR